MSVQSLYEVRMKHPLLLVPFAFTSANLLAQADGIYVSDAGGFSNPPWQILRYDPDGSDPVAFITEELAWPQDILFLDDTGQILISNLNSGRITRYDATSGAYIGDFATGISGPTRMAIGPDSLLYVLQWSGNCRVRRYGLDGTYQGEFTTVGVAQSIGLDWDVDDNLYVSSYSGDHVRRFDPFGNDMGLLVTTNLAGPTNIWFDGSGDLLVADYDGGKVERYNAAGMHQSTFITGLAGVEGVAHYPDGGFLLGNGGTHSVKRYTADGQYVEDIIPNGSGGLMTPNAIVLRGEGATGMEQHGAPTRVRVHPTTGRYFRIDAPEQGSIRNVVIRSLAGDVVQRVTHRTWHADGVGAGMYMVTITLQDGSTIAQRIAVID